VACEKGETYQHIYQLNCAGNLLKEPLNSAEHRLSAIAKGNILQGVPHYHTAWSREHVTVRHGSAGHVPVRHVTAGHDAMAFVSLIQLLFHLTTISAMQNVGSSAY
jgi:flagellar basal body P-ring protein FlgI